MEVFRTRKKNEEEFPKLTDHKMQQIYNILNRMSVSCDLWLNLLKEENQKVNSKNFSTSVADESVQLLCRASLYISLVNLV